MTLKKITGNEEDFLNLPMLIASNYGKLKQYDSAYVFLDYTKKQYTSIRDSTFLKALNFTKSKLQLKQKKYKEAINSLLKYIPSAKKDFNNALLSASYSMLGISFDNINNHQKAFFYHQKADSLYSKYKLHTFYIEESYQFLINKFKNEGNQQHQLTFINKLLEIKSSGGKNDVQIKKSLYEEYDKPKLIADKNKIINQLKQKSFNDKIYKAIYLLLIILILIILGFQIKKKSIYQKQFSKIIDNKTSLKS